MPSTDPSAIREFVRAAAAWWPGLAAATVATAIALALNSFAPSISPLTICVLLGVLVGNCGIDISRLRPGLQIAAKKLLRLGIVVLGLRLAVGDVLGLGAGVLVAIVTIVVITFFGTQWLGRRLGLSRGTSLLMGTGFSICGASAVAAMDGVTKNEESEVVTAITMVTLFGTLAIVVLPALQHPLGLSDHDFGLWTGASVHDVAQTVAAASVAGPTALAVAVVVKLTRVVLLAPMVAGMSLYRRRSSQLVGAKKPPLVPLFVLGFIAMVAIRSSGILPEGVLTTAKTIETCLLAAALFGLGSSVRIAELVRTGGRAVLLGGCSWVLIAAMAFGAVHLVG